jgi:hypothetical protein
MDTMSCDDEFWKELMGDIDATTSAEAADFTILQPHHPSPQEEPLYSSYAVCETAFEYPSRVPFHVYPVNPVQNAQPIDLLPSVALVPPPHSPSPGFDDLRRAMDALVARFHHVPLARFKKEAGNAWRRKYPDSAVPMRDFQAFVKANIKGVRSANPDASHADHMRAVGQMWRTTKKRKTEDTD